MKNQLLLSLLLFYGRLGCCPVVKSSACGLLSWPSLCHYFRAVVDIDALGGLARQLAALQVVVVHFHFA